MLGNELHDKCVDLDNNDAIGQNRRGPGIQKENLIELK